MQKKVIVKATKRERTDIKIKTFAVFLYFNGLSLKAVSVALEYLGYSVSHEAVRKWSRLLAKYISEFLCLKRYLLRG